jgi:hypothetical protein
MVKLFFTRVLKDPQAQDFCSSISLRRLIKSTATQQDLKSLEGKRRDHPVFRRRKLMGTYGCIEEKLSFCFNL